MRFAPLWRSLFRHLNFQKWSEPGVFCAFWLSKYASRHNGVNFLSLIWPDGSAPAALASPLFDPPEPQIIGKTDCFAISKLRSIIICRILAGPFQNLSSMLIRRCWCLSACPGSDTGNQPGCSAGGGCDENARSRSVGHAFASSWLHQVGGTTRATTWHGRGGHHWEWGFVGHTHIRIYIYIIIYIYIHIYMCVCVRVCVIDGQIWSGMVTTAGGKGVSFSFCCYVYCRELELPRKLVDILDVLENQTWHKPAEAKVLLCGWRFCKDWRA